MDKSGKYEHRSELSTEAIEVLGLYRDARSAELEEDRENKSVIFLRKLSMIIEPNKLDPDGRLNRWYNGARKHAKEIVFDDDATIIVSSGTRGCRIRISTINPVTNETGHWMTYNKPSKEDWIHGGEFWENFIKHFKTSVVNLDKF